MTELAAKATAFKEKLEESLTAFTGTRHELGINQLGEAISIRTRQDDDMLSQDSSKPIKLFVAGEALPLLGIELDLSCIIGEGHGHLTVEHSTIKVWPKARTTGEPLFRYEFIRNSTSTVPSAHLQVHAHRDAFTHLMGHAGKDSNRARRRSQRPLNGKIPAVSEYHFPLGGPRFRPCLEDILESLRVEFGLQVDPNIWLPKLRVARKEWRNKQLAAAIRDSPAEAIKIIQDLIGEDILIPNHLRDNDERLYKS